MVGRSIVTDAAESLSRAWARLAQAVAESPTTPVNSDRPVTDTELAEGFDYWAQVLTFGLRRELHYGDPQHPMFHRIGLDTKIGFDNPDNVYQIAKIDPARSYRITGTRGTAKFIEFSVSVGFPGVAAPPRTVSKLDTTELGLEEDGTLELIVGGPPRQSNWLPVDDEATSVLVRQVFGHWREDDTCGDFRIEPLDPDWHGASSAVLDSAEMIRRINATAQFVETQARYWIDYAEALRARIAPNTFEEPGIQGQQLVQVNAARAFFCWGLFALAEDQALIVELDPPGPGSYLGFHLVNYWLQSLDYVGRITSLNMDQAHMDSDGRIRYVLAHRDPHVPNWLDIGGHPWGGMLFRTALTSSATRPTTRVVDADKIRDCLPVRTPTIDAAARRAQIRARRSHIASRFRW